MQDRRDTETDAEDRMADSPPPVQRGIDADRYYHGKYTGRRMPRGPLGTEETGPPAAIGFCAFCGTNARDTTGFRGVFDCPECFHIWHDSRVGTQPKSLDDFFSDS